MNQRAIVKPAGSLIIALLSAYKKTISPWLPPACRFIPTCSEYAGDAILKYGALEGSRKALGRLMRCHPFHRGGPDPLD